jgi:hypothetical protein
MAAFSEFIINDDWKVEVVLYWDSSYVLHSGILLPIKQIESWCRNCRNVVASELIPTIEDISREIAMLSDPSDKIHKCFGQSTIKEWFANEKLRLQWRKARTSPAHCLDCFSTNLTHIMEDDIVDVDSGTKIHRVTTYGHASMNHEVFRRLTPEGALIETDDPLHAIKFH